MNQMFHAANVSISINLIKSSRNPVLSFPAGCCGNSESSQMDVKMHASADVCAENGALRL